MNEGLEVRILDCVNIEEAGTLAHNVAREKRKRDLLGLVSEALLISGCTELSGDQAAFTQRGIVDKRRNEGLKSRGALVR